MDGTRGAGMEGLLTEQGPSTGESTGGAGMTNFYFCKARGDFVLGGFWLGGILSGGILSGGILARGDFVLGGFCPGGYCPGGF